MHTGGSGDTTLWVRGQAGGTKITRLTLKGVFLFGSISPNTNSMDDIPSAFVYVHLYIRVTDLNQTHACVDYSLFPGLYRNPFSCIFVPLLPAARWSFNTTPHGLGTFRHLTFSSVDPSNLQLSFTRP